MNLIDWLLTGGALLTWWVMPIMLAVGYVTPWPYNYWRLKNGVKLATRRADTWRYNNVDSRQTGNPDGLQY
jgi:hypothetical protein